MVPSRVLNSAAVSASSTTSSDRLKPPAAMQQLNDVSVVPSDIWPLKVTSSIKPEKFVPIGVPE